MNQENDNNHSLETKMKKVIQQKQIRRIVIEKTKRVVDACIAHDVDAVMTGDVIIDAMCEVMLGKTDNKPATRLTLLIEGTTAHAYRIVQTLGGKGLTVSVDDIDVSLNVLLPELTFRETLALEPISLDTVGISIHEKPIIDSFKGLSDIEQSLVDIETPMLILAYPVCFVRAIRMSTVYNLRLGTSLARGAVLYGSTIQLSVSIKKELAMSGPLLSNVLDTCHCFRALKDLDIEIARYVL